MTLVQPIHVAPKQDREPALQAVFEKRYAWLLRWALHFTENDRAEAEDLVQKTFVRLLLTWDTLRDLDDLEPLLYSYLRYEHLSERRRGRSHAFQRLSTADFDTLAMSLRGSSTFDQIEIQNEIREILAFLLWRKRTARFASMFLLRFFHGYFPEEIASICISKRVAVDLGLSQARRELKAHMADPRQIRVLGRSSFPEQKPVNTAIPVDDFEQELRRNIFCSHSEPCPSVKEFERAYNSLTQRSLETNLLTHIVACEPCLEKAVLLCNVAPPSSRSMDNSLERSPRGKGKHTRLTSKQRLACVFAEGERRMREIYEHHPAGLVIALNTQVVAVRDIDVNTPHAVLKVETHDVPALEIIDVFSEQGLLLMSMPVLLRPPKSQPEIRHQISLSGDRTLSLLISFHTDGALIETVYEDPHCATAAEEAMALTDASAAEILVSTLAGPGTGPSLSSIRNTSVRLWHRFTGGVKNRLRKVTPLTATCAVLLAAIALLAWMEGNRQSQRIDANQLLRAAVRAGSTWTRTDQQAVVHQSVRIADAEHTLNRNLYRDLNGKRRPKELAMNEEEKALRAKLTEARLDWNDPLSAQSYRAWHDQLFREEDRVAETGNSLITVTTKAAQGSVTQESLTVRADDLRTVARTVLFRDGETVEIAELSYEVVPWGPKVEPWFEPSTTAASYSSPSTADTSSMSLARLSDAQLDVAELSVVVALQELNADAERLEVTRTPNSVTVKGVVDSDDRKAAISARLKTIAHVNAAIYSYREMDAKSVAASTVSTLQAVSVTVADTPLKAECEQEKIEPDRCRQLSYTLLSASTLLVRESKSMTNLRREYPAARPLTSTAQALLTEITVERVGHMHAALDQQERALQALSVDLSRGTENGAVGSPFLEDAVQHNLALCKELVYVSNEHSRSASLILQELARIEHETRIALSRTEADFGANSIPTFPYATPGQ